MICSNRKTRVFDPWGHETFIAHVSLTHVNAFASCFANIMSSLDLTALQVMAKLGSLIRYAFSCITPAAHLPILLPLSNDDHSYFVRWKLPTETPEVFDDNKWLRLSSSIPIHLEIVSMGLDI